MHLEIIANQDYNQKVGCTLTSCNFRALRLPVIDLPLECSIPPLPVPLLANEDLSGPLIVNPLPPALYAGDGGTAPAVCLLFIFILLSIAGRASAADTGTTGKEVVLESDCIGGGVLAGDGGRLPRYILPSDEFVLRC